MKKRVSCKTGNKTNFNQPGCRLTCSQAQPDGRTNGYNPAHDRMSTYTVHTASDLGIGFNEVSGIY